MEIKTDEIDTYTKKIVKLLNECQSQKIIIYLLNIYIAFNFCVCLFILSKINLFFLTS
jgi:hypothetical protein